ncbi:sarcosine oxidase subunit beta [Arthrobacter pascens]|nr:FAD-binding oxidoreductase [Arthrobacter pascens]MDQ0676984.1 sarcosine oxidase subunit beta [Arthrobacter pascens]
MLVKHVDNIVPLVKTPGRPLPAAGDIVILGGGIMGTSIAYHLAEAGVKNIVLIERNALGSGSSAKPLGGVRATFSDPGNIRLGQRSLEAFERFGEKFRTDIGLRQVGYLFLCRNEAELLQVEDSTHIQNHLGGSSRMVTPDQAHQINPFLDPRALVAASYSPRDGFAQPSKVVQAYAEAAQQLGVTICQDTEILDLDAGGGEVQAVHTNRGTIRTPTVICAAGAWSTRLGAMAGVHLPIEPVRRQIGMTAQGSKPLPTVPFTLDLSTTLYFHNYLNGMLLGISNQDQGTWFLPGVRLPVAAGLQPGCGNCRTLLGPPGPGSRLGRIVRKHTGPQRHDRVFGHCGGIHVRHRILGSWLPAGPGSG